MTGPLVDPFPWTMVEKVERNLTERQYSLMLERFLVAEEYIRARDALREMTGVGLEVDYGTAQRHIGRLLERFDELEFGYIPRQRIPELVR